jgi:HSP20 family protein
VTRLALLDPRTFVPDWPVTRTASEVCIPPADVAETPDGVVVTMELPGTEAAAVRIVVERGVLVIEGTKRPSISSIPRTTLLRVLRVERSSGAFRRTLLLPRSVDPGGGRARLEAGVLTILLPRLAPEG